MSERCPRCGGKADGLQPDPMARCEYCGALLAAPGLSGPPLQATPRYGTQQARDLAHRRLNQIEAEGLRVGEARLVFYPFAVDGPARKPYRPLATLPPLVERSWHASGADLTREVAEDETDETLAASRIPIALEVSPRTPVVMYPFYQLSLDGPQGESACWCDGVDGQVMLPEDLGKREDRRQSDALGRAARWSFALSAGGALLLPFPFSLAVAVAAGVVLWSKVARW